MSDQPQTRPMASYWPQIGIGLGLVLNIGGAITGDDKLFATGTNVLVLCTGFAIQRRQNERREE